MRQILALVIISICLTACSQKYFIVRHAEKAQAGSGLVMATPNDPPLTDAGLARAETLAQRLSHEKIRLVYSTQTIRTQSTAAPTALVCKVQVIAYKEADSSFISLLKTSRKNILVVAHSNTVDELVNGLLGKHQISDLPDNAYDNLFIVTRHGKKWRFSQEKYGEPLR